VVADVAVAVGFGMLGLAFRDSVAGDADVGGGVSPDRLREYFDVLARYPLNPPAAD
jgi:hypothetical protein